MMNFKLLLITSLSYTLSLEVSPPTHWIQSLVHLFHTAPLGQKSANTIDLQVLLIPNTKQNNNKGPNPAQTLLLLCRYGYVTDIIGYNNQ